MAGRLKLSSGQVIDRLRERDFCANWPGEGNERAAFVRSPEKGRQIERSGAGRNGTESKERESIGTQLNGIDTRFGWRPLGRVGANQISRAKVANRTRGRQICNILAADCASGSGQLRAQLAHIGRPNNHVSGQPNCGRAGRVWSSFGRPLGAGRPSTSRPGRLVLAVRPARERAMATGRVQPSSRSIKFKRLNRRPVSLIQSDIALAGRLRASRPH